MRKSVIKFIVSSTNNTVSAYNINDSVFIRIRLLLMDHIYVAFVVDNHIYGPYILQRLLLYTI